MKRWMQRLLGVLAALLILSVPVGAQPFSAQIQAALRAFLQQAHTWTALQTFASITVTGACTGCGGGVPTDGTGFTTNLISTKADPTLIFSVTTAGDTDFWFGVQDDAGGDNDDGLWVGAGTTPGVGNTTVFGALGRPASTLGGLSNTNNEYLTSFLTEFTDLTNWKGLCVNNLGGVPGFGSCGSGNNMLVLRGFSTGAGTAAMRLQDSGTGHWDLGEAALGVRTGYFATGVALDNNLSLRAGAPTVANIGANSCGTTAATITGNNSFSRTTVGATSGTACRVTFSSAWANAPACACNNEVTSNLCEVTLPTTAKVDLVGTFVAADTLSLVCGGF